MYLFLRFDTLGNAPVWTLAIYPFASCTVMNTFLVLVLFGSCSGVAVESCAAASRSKVNRAGRPRLVVLVVDLDPAGCCRIWPILVASSTPMNLFIASAVKPGHPCKYPALAAAARTRFG